MSNQYNSNMVSDMARLCEPFCSEDNSRLYPLVVAGNADARRQMIEGNMSLAVAKVESLIRCFPDVAHLRVDLTSAAFVGLTKAVNKMAAGKGPRNTDPAAPTDFIGMWINRELGRLVEEAPLIRVPHESNRLAKQKEEPIAPPIICNVIPERFEVPSYERELEMRDLIESCCTCKEERTFVAMREAGHTLDEIAFAIGMSRTTMYRMTKELEARVMRKLEALRDE